MTSPEPLRPVIVDPAYAGWDLDTELCSWGDDPRRAEIEDGIRCVVCGEARGVLVPVGHGPRGQLFACPDCADGRRS